MLRKKNRLKHLRPGPAEPQWREYQKQIHRSARTSLWLRSGVRILPVLLVAVLLVYFAFSGLGGAACHRHFDGKDKSTAESSSKPVPVWSKQQVRKIFASRSLANLQQQSFETVVEGKQLRIETTLDMRLQRYLMESLNPSTAKYIAIVAQNPVNGEVLAMASYDKANHKNNPCVENEFAAASIFKIVTAAAAIEKKQFQPGVPLTYNGRRYTLYKSQIKEKKNRYTQTISFRDSFAQSVNPVFGKIGALYLGKEILEQYAERFGFNEPIDFELDVPPSVFAVEDTPYRLAEIASGFNRTTTITPLHGALIASSIANGGRLIEPTMVRRITDAYGNVLYENHTVTRKQTLEQETSQTLATLMTETIKSGTLRKVFRGWKNHPVLSKLVIGAKTGSINNRAHDARLDWFVGFAKDKRGDKKIVFSVLVAHEEYIGIRAGKYAKLAIAHYFQDYFASRKQQTSDG